MSKSTAILLMEELLGVSRAEATDEVKATRSAYARFSFLERVYNEKIAAGSINEAARAFLLWLVGNTIFVDKSFTSVRVDYLMLFRDLDTVSRYAWGTLALVYLYDKLTKATKTKTKQLAGATTLFQVFFHAYNFFTGN
jgi:hypothetical protein